MRCCKCGNVDTKVLESRLSQEGRSVRRRRECTQCGERFTTYEKMELASFQVQKRDGRLEPYQREKVSVSIQIACRKRPISLETIDEILGRVEKQVENAGLRTVNSKLLGEWVLAELQSLDSIAYVRFASVYKDFKTPVEFLRELHLFSAAAQEGAEPSGGPSRQRE